MAFQAYFHATNRKYLTVAFLDVGQGDGIFVEAPNGNQMLIDAGGGIAILDALKDVMPFYDRSIDLIMITNPDKDHIGGFLPVLNRYEVKEVIEPGTGNKSQTYSTLQTLISEEGARKTFAYDISRIELDKEHNIYFEIFFPDRDVSEMTSNDGSIVGKLEYGSTTILFTGDTTKATENYVLKIASSSLDADILKVAHHGSRTSSREEFVKAVSPDVAVISLGKDNSYGHPHRETIETFKKENIKILRTDELGTIIIQSDGKSFWVK